jgi:hypothetical protein
VVRYQISICETYYKDEADRYLAYRQQGKPGRYINKSTTKSRLRKDSKTTSEQEGNDRLI